MKTETKTFAYCRVSSKDQNLDRQIDSLSKFVADERDIYCDKASGKDFDRTQYQNLKRQLRKGDTVYIHSLDRLGRNKVQIFEEISFFKEQGVFVKILNIPSTLIDYSTMKKDEATIMEMVNNILFEVLATFAESERDLIRKRQAEGIKVAKAKGKHFGRPSLKFPADWKEKYEIWKAGEVTATELFTHWGISNTSFYKLVKLYEQGAE